MATFVDYTCVLARMYFVETLVRTRIMFVRVV